MGALSAVQHTMQAQPSHVCGGPGICVCVRACHHYFNHRLTQATGMCPNSSKASVCVRACACQHTAMLHFVYPRETTTTTTASTTKDTHNHVPTCHLAAITHIQTHVHMSTHEHTFTQPQRGLIMGCERFGVTVYTRAQWHPIQQHLVLSYQSKWISISSTGMRLHATVPS